MKHVREHFPAAALGSIAWWLMEHVLDKSIVHLMEVLTRVLTHLPG